MNDPLLERASGSLGQNAFARRHCTQLLHTFRPAPRLRFDGGELGTNIAPEEGGGPSSSPSVATTSTPRPRDGRDIWAHQAGVNAMALERFDGRM